MKSSKGSRAYKKRLKECHTNAEIDRCYEEEMGRIDRTTGWGIFCALLGAACGPIAAALQPWLFVVPAALFLASYIFYRRI